MTNEEAIKKIKANYPSGGYEDLREALAMAIEALQERKTGKWKRIARSGDDECSVCGNFGFRDWHYCQWCGAKMEADEW